MFNRIYFEISGICNGKCWWCQTGKRNISGTSSGKFVDFNEFKRAIFYLRENGFIGVNTEIALYNWGEPFLHPKFKEIIKFLNTENLKVVLSTNCSKAVLFEEDGILSNVQQIILSMPGFSQRSYDRIHGFNFRNIIKNILEITRNFRSVGFQGRFLLAFHVYQFNVNEILPAAEFAKQNQIIFLPSLAFINDLERALQYVNSELESSDLKKATQDLFYFYLTDEAIEERKKQRPKDYICPQYSLLNIDDDCNVITCCGDNTRMDKIFNVKAREVNNWRINSSACAVCRKVGMDYLPPAPPLLNITTFGKQ